MKKYDIKHLPIKHLSEATKGTTKELNSVIKALGGYPPNVTVVTYKDGTVAEYEIVGTLGQNSIQNKNNIVSVKIGNTVTNIGNSAFHNCAYLSSVTIPNTVTIISDVAFADTKLTSVVIPDSVISIGESAFYDCYSLSSCIFGNNVESIGSVAFEHCNSLSTISPIPSSITSIGHATFYGTNFSEIVFEEKSMDYVQGMTDYSFGISEGASIVCSDGTIIAPNPGGS